MQNTLIPLALMHFFPHLCTVGVPGESDPGGERVRHDTL